MRHPIVNRPAAYLITVSNPGTMPVTNVIVSTEVTEGMTLVSATRGGFLSNQRKRFDKVLNRDVSYQEIRWSFATLAPGERQRLEMVLQTTNVGKLDHLVRVSADRNLEHRAQVQTEFEEATGLTSEIEPSANPIEVGGKLTYKFRVINQGGAVAKNIGLSVLVPEQLAILKDKLEPTTRVDGQKVTFAPLLALAPKTPGATAPNLTEFVLEVQALKSGEARLRVELTSDLLVAGPVKDEVSTTIVGDLPGK